MWRTLTEAILPSVALIDNGSGGLVVSVHKKVHRVMDSNQPSPDVEIAKRASPLGRRGVRISGKDWLERYAGHYNSFKLSIVL